MRVNRQHLKKVVCFRITNQRLKHRHRDGAKNVIFRMNNLSKKKIRTFRSWCYLWSDLFGLFRTFKSNQNQCFFWKYHFMVVIFMMIIMVMVGGGMKKTRHSSSSAWCIITVMVDVCKRRSSSTESWMTIRFRKQNNDNISLPSMMNKKKLIDSIRRRRRFLGMRKWINILFQSKIHDMCVWWWEKPIS